MAAPVIILFCSFLLLVGLGDYLTQTSHSFLLVGMLAPFFCAHNCDSGWEINSSDTGLDFVDVLTAFATAPEGFKYYLICIEFFTLSNSARTEVNEPVFPLMLGAIRATANPFD